ncbi:uncharacterized protein LOC128557688 isoform X2 [Mercenaria mercenaria]|nr:uncharacterized protein LOC128557688 isoform X2 [Mercenaria mercenaria]
MLRPLVKRFIQKSVQPICSNRLNKNIVVIRKPLHRYISSRNIRYPKMTGGNLITMKLDSPEFQALFTPELNQLITLFEKNNFEIRIAGGAVRDLLMEKQLHDVDFATTATPEQMKEMFELAGIRMINAKGEGHGTITARINDKENFEVTTLRIDIRTDGRHAEVEFTKDWQLDANRRDLTINAMFLGFDGTVYDYFNGIEDVKNQRVRFVGNPEDRIQEDYLRILRYFRFYGRIAKTPNDHDDGTLKAIKENAEGLSGISGERIWVELKKIVVGNYAGSIMKSMVETGISKYIGFAEDANIEEFQKICEQTEGQKPEPMTRIAALLENSEQVYEMNKRLKVSNDELKTCLFIVMYRDQEEGDDLIKHYKHLIARLSGKEKKVVNRVLELFKYKGLHDMISEISEWTPPKYPITGQDLIEKDIKRGPVFAKTLDALRQVWIDSDFQLTREELLEKIDEVIAHRMNMKERCGAGPHVNTPLTTQEMERDTFSLEGVNDKVSYGLDNDGNYHESGTEHQHEAKQPDKLEEYFEYIYETECKFHVEQNKTQFIENAIETFVRLNMDSYYRYMNYFDDSTCNITHCYPELLKVGSFYEHTKNKFPKEFDYLLVIGNVTEMPHKCYKSHSFLTHGETFVYVKNESTFIKGPEIVNINGPAHTSTFSYQKGDKDYKITVDISIALRCAPDNLSNLLKESTVYCEQFYPEILNTGSFLFIKHDIAFRSPGQWKFAVTETECLFMKETLSETHKKAYMILKFLINGNVGNDVLKYIHKKFSFCISSYNIKTAMIYHHYKCKREGLNVADCILDVLKHFQKKIEIEVDRVKTLPPGLKVKKLLRIEPDLLIENTYSMKKHVEDREYESTKETQEIFQLSKIPHSVRRVHRALVQAYIDDVERIVECFDVFIRRLNILKEDNNFSECDHGCNNTILEMLLEVPAFAHYFRNSERVQDLLACQKKLRNEHFGKVMHGISCCRWCKFQ